MTAPTRDELLLAACDRLESNSDQYWFTADAKLLAAFVRDTLGQDGGWRPIAEAPRDRTAILVMRNIWPGTETGFAEKCNGHNTYVVEWWANEGENKSGRWMCYMDMIEDPECPIEPTHWQPLPTLPASVAPVKGGVVDAGSQ